MKRQCHQCVFFYIYLPEGHFGWTTLKNVCRSVRPAPTAATTATDFWGFLSLCRSAPYTIFGCHSQGIREELKFRDRSLFSFTVNECTT